MTIKTEEAFKDELRRCEENEKYSKLMKDIIDRINIENIVLHDFVKDGKTNTFILAAIEADITKAEDNVGTFTGMWLELEPLLKKL